MGARTPTGRELDAFTSAFNDCSAWQVLGAMGSVELGEWQADVISRGPIPIVEPSDFGDIEQYVELDHNPEDTSFRRVYVARYAGDLVGFHLFAHILTTDLDRGAEGNVNMITKTGGSLHIIRALFG